MKPPAVDRKTSVIAGQIASPWIQKGERERYYLRLKVQIPIQYLDLNIV
jgi:hypothetical protein